MVLPAWLSSFFAALGLSACTFATPASGPGLDGLSRSLDPATPVIVAITHVTVEADDDARRRFWAANALVADQIKAAPGLLTHSLRRQPFGDEGWTLSVWRDTDSLLAFKRSGAHQAALTGVYDAFADARFARLRMPAGEVPKTWDEALILLEANARQYYE